MARPLDKEAYTKKRNKILDIVLELMYAKGYEQLSIQDVQDRLGISSGAMHHYFKTRETLLEALIGRIRHQWENSLLPIVQNQNLSALEKLQGFFVSFDTDRNAHKIEILQILQGWYADSNSIVRQRVHDAKMAHSVPLLAQIIDQGKNEGTFTADNRTAEIIMLLICGMEDAQARLLIAVQNAERERYTSDIVELHNAYVQAIERILRMPAGSLQRISASAVRPWVELAG